MMVLRVLLGKGFHFHTGVRNTLVNVKWISSKIKVRIFSNSIIHANYQANIANHPAEAGV